MKNKKFLFAAFAALCVLFASAAFAREREPGDVKASELLDTRQTSVWVEGERLGDMVIGARGALQIIYVDKKLANALTLDFSISDWAKQMAQYYGSDGTRGKLFHTDGFAVHKVRLVACATRQVAFRYPEESFVRLHPQPVFR